MRLAILALASLLAGCAVPAPQSPQSRPPPVSVPPIEPLALDPVRWHVLSAADLKALLAKPHGAVYALDATSYHNLAMNFVSIKRYIEQQKAVIVLLKKVAGVDTDRSPDAAASLDQSAPKLGAGTPGAASPAP